MSDRHAQGDRRIADVCELPEVVARYIRAANERDWNTVASCYASDAQFWVLGSQVATGPQQIAAALRKNMESLSDTHDEVVRATISGPLVLVEMTFTGRAPSGEAFKIAAADVFELSADGATILRVSAWLDSAQIPTN